MASIKADLICIARAVMWDSRRACHAAEVLGAEAPYPPKPMPMPCHPKNRPQLSPKRAQTGS